jgi:hypothetical protein
MSKSYDLLSWTFLPCVLKTFGFCHDWILWIRNLVSSAFFSILVNDSPSDTFNPSRAVRQWDPLSPFLFILAVKGLGISIKEDLSNGRIIGIKVNPNIDPLSHLQFVDGTMLLGGPFAQEAQTFKLLSFSTKINHDKSLVFFFNTPLRVQAHILRILGFHKGSLPSKYPGAPLLENSLQNMS